MNRLPPTLASGILFSKKAGSNAKPDVRRPRNATRGLNFSSNSQQIGVAQGMLNLITKENLDEYAIFPRFEETPTPRPRTQLPPAGDSALPSIFPSEDPVFCLPILSVSIDVSIDGTISLTTLTQSFHNPSDFEITEARHTFPLYHGAVVTSFQCMIGESRRLRGVVKPTWQAKVEFKEAKAKKKVAALLEEHTPEVFETSLGNIPAKTTVQVILTYVHELKAVTSKEEKSEGLALIIPASIAPRYAAAATPGPLPQVPGYKLEIHIQVLDNGEINPVTSYVESNHRTATTYEGLQPSSSAPIMNIAELHSLKSASSSAQKPQHMWKYTSKSQPALKNDFIFVIQLLGQTRLQSCAVITPPNDVGHAALMVSLRPNDLFGSAVRPELFRGEILFVIDRSGSMDWTESGINIPKIETARDAMSLVLHGLPTTCKFNIISFGSEVRGMWNRSRGANEPENLSFASQYLTTIKADMIGTEVLLALKGAVSNREPRCPSTQIILITDGEIVDESHTAILKYVWETREKLGKNIRFFTLGIGEGVSHSVVESIAELGGGYCDVVDITKKPGWEDRLNRMVLSALEPNEWTCDIDLGLGYERRSLASYAFRADERPDTSLGVYAQGPHPIPPLHPFRYKSFFFLLDTKGTELPKTVTIKTTLDTAKEMVYIMDVKPSQLRGGTIHPLAVKAILLSLEDEMRKAGANEEQARINAEFLGTEYAIPSRWTSFIALSDESIEQSCQIEVYKSHLKQINISELLVSEGEETSEAESELVVSDHIEVPTTSSHTVASGGTFGGSVTIHSGRMNQIYINAKGPGYAVPSRTNQIYIKRREPRFVMSSRSKFREYGASSITTSIIKGPAVTDTPNSKEACFNTPQDIQEHMAQNDSPYTLVSVSNSFKGVKKTVRNSNEEGIHSDHGDDGDYETADPFSPRSSMFKQPYFIRTALRHLKWRRTPKDAADEDASTSLAGGDTDDDETGSYQSISSTGDHNPAQLIRTALRRVKRHVLRGIGVKRNESDKNSSDNIDSDYDSSNSYMDVNAENEDVLFRIPSHDGPLTWRKVAGCEKGGLFILPREIQKHLGQHFCSMTVQQLHETLGKIPGMSQVTTEETTALIDTLMVIQYFKTHLSVQENYWCLLIEKARCALLLALGYTEDQEEALEPLYETLLSAMLHVHFPESFKHASVYQEETGTGSNSSATVCCLVCNAPIEANCGTQLAVNKGFMCLADDCCDTNTQSRKCYISWVQFWRHQIKSGHMICPEIEDE